MTLYICKWQSGLPLSHGKCLLLKIHRTLDLRASCTGAVEAEPVQLAATADEAAVLRYLLVKPFEKFWEKADSISILVSGYINA